MLKKIFQKLLGQLLLAVVAFALLVWATLHLLDYYTDHGKYIVVPDLTKKTLTEVQLLKKNTCAMRYSILLNTTLNIRLWQ